MNTWVVGNAPVGHYEYEFQKKTVGSEGAIAEAGEKVFFMKARIMAGQADLRENKLRLEDFKWLAKEEVEQHVTNKYWSSIRHMLSER